MSLKSAIEMMDTAKEGLVTVTDEDISRLHGIYLGFLKDLDSFCTANQISYALGGGSMLGAIRHKGFIPWDDDLDITMTREDFDRFAKLSGSFVPDRYYLKKPGDKGYIFHWPKIYIKGVLFSELLSTEDSPRDLFVDVFIVEDLTDNKLARKVRGIISSFYLLACSCSRVRACRSYCLPHMANSPDVRKEIDKRAHIGLIFACRKIEKWCSKADRFFGSHKDPGSKDIVIPSGARHFWGEIYPREVLTLTRKVPFEDITVNVPLYAEKYLEQRYGKNYMEIPPKTERAKHALLELKTEGLN